MLQPSIVYTEVEPPSLKALITDPYILLAAGKKKCYEYLKNYDYLGKLRYVFKVIGQSVHVDRFLPYRHFSLCNSTLTLLLCKIRYRI